MDAFKHARMVTNLQLIKGLYWTCPVLTLWILTNEAQGLTALGHADGRSRDESTVKRGLVGEVTEAFGDGIIRNTVPPVIVPVSPQPNPVVTKGSR